jgi:pimeloyl-ACP methyl ester carboxylesterase
MLSTMAKIVLVHGAFNELWGPNELRARWLPALRDGLWHHGVDVAEHDVAVAFYGDLFRHDPEVAEPAGLDQARADVSKALGGLQGDDLLGAVHMAANHAAFDRTADMVAMMLTVPDLDADVRRRVVDAIAPDTRVVIAHSLGSVITHRTLAEHPELDVPLLVTVGSPLGSSKVFGTLTPPPVDGVGAWPGGVRRWVNIAAVGDKATTEVPRLAERFGARVEDRLVNNGHRAHDPEPYLNSTVTGLVVADALGA